MPSLLSANGWEYHAKLAFAPIPEKEGLGYPGVALLRKGSACPDDKQCKMTTETGCTVYEARIHFMAYHIPGYSQYWYRIWPPSRCTGSIDISIPIAGWRLFIYRRSENVVRVGIQHFSILNVWLNPQAAGHAYSFDSL